MTITVTLTSDNGNTRSVKYVVPFTKEYAHHVFETLKRQAWDATEGQASSRTLRADGDDSLSREASYFTPEV